MVIHPLLDKILTNAVSLDSDKKAYSPLVLEYIACLILARLLDEEDQKTVSLGKNVEGKWVFPKNQQHLRWSNLIQADETELKRLLNGEPTDEERKEYSPSDPWLNLFQFFRSAPLEGQDSELSKLSKLFQDVEYRIDSDEIAYKIVSSVNELPFLHGKSSELGELNKCLLEKCPDNQKEEGDARGDMIQSLIEIVAPQLGDIICDPLCGTGGFFIQANKYILSHVEEKFSLSKSNSQTLYHGFNTSPLTVRLAAMNMLLYQIKGVSIEWDNPISDQSTIDELQAKCDVVVTDIPLGRTMRGEEIHKGLLGRVKTQKTDLLTLVLVEHLLKAGGRGAVIVPESVLSDDSDPHKSVRLLILEDNQLEAVVTFPSSKEGIRKNILVFTKGSQTGHVFFYNMECQENISELIDQWNHWKQIRHGESKDFQPFNKRESNCFCVSKSEIMGNDCIFSFERYRNSSEEPIEHSIPKKVLEEPEFLSAPMIANEQDEPGEHLERSRSTEISEPRILSITLENFKGISKKVTIPLRPITLLFGKNSAGKSTILQALLYTGEVLRTGRVDIDHVQFGGDSINLGGFRNLVHLHDVHRTVLIRIDFTLGPFGLESFREFDDIYVEQKTDILRNAKTSFVELELGTLNNSPCIKKFTVGIDDDPLASLVNGEDKQRARIELPPSQLVIPNDDTSTCDDDDINTSEFATVVGEKLRQLSIASLGIAIGMKNVPYIGVPIMFGAAAGVVMANYFGSNVAEKYIETRHATIGQQAVLYHEMISLLNSKKDDLFIRTFNGILPASGRPIEIEYQSAAPSQVDTEQANEKQSIECYLSRIFVRPMEQLRDLLENVRYIGPIRQIPERNIEQRYSPDESRWSDGTAAWDILSYPRETESGRVNRLIDKVNYYLKDVLKMGYEVQRKQYFELTVDGDEMRQLKDNALNFSKVDQATFHQLVMKRMMNLPKTISVKLYDLTAKVHVLPKDIGVGVSQIIPVIIGAIADNVNKKSPGVVAMEQPELHVHPAVQCNLGDVFIREKSENKTFLLETHSEHLILRFLRRIGETTDNKLKDQKLALKPKELSVLYVGFKNGVTTFTELPVDEEGEFTVRWPEGFFDERATELFGESEDV